MGKDQAKRKGKETTSGSSDIEQITCQMGNLKSTLEQYLSVAKVKEKNHDVAILTKNTSNLNGREKESMLKAK